MRRFSIIVLSLSIALFCLFVSFNGAVAQTSGELTPAAVFDELARQSGNKTAYARIITDNPEAWYARWHMLSNAKKSIDTTYFIVDKDVFGMAFLGLLLKKAKEGVKVRLMMDARGSKDLSHKMLGQDFLQELLEVPGVEVKVYNPITSNLLSMFGNLANVVSSNHDKIIIVDNEYVVTGGRNIEMNYFVDPKDFPRAYRDTDVIFKGPAAAVQIQKAFDEEFNSHSVSDVKRELFGNWVSRAKELEFARRAMESYICGIGLVNAQIVDKDFEKYIKELSEYKNLQSFSGYTPFSGDHQYPFLMLDKNSMKGTRNDITPGIGAMIRSAKSEIIIQNPYVVLTAEAMDALREANARGVKINVHTNSPMSTDSTATQVFFTDEWAKVMKELPNMRTFVFPGPQPLHSKVFVFDREITVIGSYNMDPLSQQINSEIVGVIKSKNFALRTALRIMEDEKRSIEYKIEVMKDGSVKIINGPENHSDPKKLEKLHKLQKFGFLRPLI
ncbi:MAG TPA: phosphatidylserine/phosphatidylglycerophosphate/cardiolipin synthase family protein [Candidatus Wallbacteria bacterium]|nr:phosphatidylserine/phosphatidylglycerophosphate/cardiolipin synthase family protein [Candidatus Wallbacteria bacterium]